MAEDESIKTIAFKKFLEKLLGQEAVVIVLASMLVAGSWFAHQLITLYVPQHLNQIQAGYDKAIETHGKQVEKLENQHTERIKLLIEDSARARQENREWVRSLNDRIDMITGRSPRSIDGTGIPP